MMQMLAECKRTDENVQTTHKIKAKRICTYLQDWSLRTDYAV